MSTIVLLVWLADVVDRIAVLGAAAGTLFVIAAACTAVSGWHEGSAVAKKVFPWCVAASVVCLSAWALIPSKKTVYAATALIAGYEISRTELGGKALEALNATLDEVIEKAKKP